ncbi:MAG: envelope stress response membrane protein PspC [Deferrisomatales bacterium]
MTPSPSGRKGLYRSRSGMICGVCKGLAESLDLPVFWTRVFAVGILLFSGIWPAVAAYFVAAALLKPEPPVPVHSAEEQAFYDAYAGSRQAALHHLRRTFDRLERRLRRLENRVTAPEFRWERRFSRKR